MTGEGETISGHLMARGYSNWSAYRLDDMWEMVRHEDGRTNWAQWDAWRRMAQVCNEQADQLEKASRQLLERWPNTPSSAAEAFKVFIDGLAGSMRDSAAAASVNADALYGLTTKLLRARAEIGALLQQRWTYTQAEQQMIAYTRTVSSRPPDAPIQAPPQLPQQPPDNWWDLLDQHARSIMAETDAGVGEEAARFIPPPLYRPRYDETAASREPANSEILVAQAPAPPSSFRPILDAAPIGSPHQQSGDIPVLDGGAVPGMPPVGLPDDETMPPSELPSVGTAVISRSSAIPNPDNFRASRPSQSQSASLPDTVSYLRPGGKPLSQGGPTQPLVPTLAAPTSARSPASTTSSVRPGGRVASPYGRRRTTAVDDPWAVKEGVPPVVDAPPEPMGFDPGPGVIGIDR